MATFSDLVNSINPFKPRRSSGGIQSVASAAFPIYEQQSPQFPQPQPYNLAQVGYRRNEIAYACINKRMKAIAEAPLGVYGAQTDKEDPQHKLRLLLKRPNERMGEKSFWRATQMYLCIAGFAAWEIERNNIGEPIGLHPMRPDWCSFYRGDYRPLRAVRYQPYGLPPADVPIENVLLFQYFDPIFPLLKALAPTAVANRSIGVDNDATDFIKLFFERGAVVNGLLTTEQSVNEAEASRVKEVWAKNHGGYQNWADVTVLGKGLKYDKIQMNFNEMDFSSIDGRDEARVCQVFEIPPILIGAKIGLERATYSNYAEARTAWYQEWVAPEWDWLESEVEQQLLPQFEDTPDNFYCDFDFSEVKALQEDKTAAWQRATQAHGAKIITTNEAREEMGLDPIEGGDEIEKPQPTPPPQFDENGKPLPPPNNQASPTDTEDANEADDETTQAAKENERKQWRAWNKRGRLQGKAFVFKHLNADEQRALTGAHASETAQAPFPRTRSIKATRADAVDAEARAIAEAALKEKIAEIFKREQDSIAEQIRNGVTPDLNKLNQDLQRAVEIELSATAAAEMLRLGAQIGVEYDTAAVNRAANEWAKQYTYTLIKDIDANTLPIVRNAISQYTQAQGMTRGDLNTLLQQGFDPVRADRIAVTETSRAYAQASQVYQGMLKEDGLEMERVWHTDNDDLVCPLCAPMNNKPESEWNGQEIPAHVNCRCGTGLRLKR